MNREADEADLVAIEDFYLRRRGEFLLGFIGDRLVAMRGFKRLSEGVGELRRVRIVSDMQGRGLGSSLLRRRFSPTLRPRQSRWQCVFSQKLAERDRGWPYPSPASSHDLECMGSRDSNPSKWDQARMALS